jgi:general nucleoside transport system permease protein
MRVISKVGGLLAAGLAVTLVWVGLIALGGRSVPGSVEALLGNVLLRPESLAATVTGAAPLLLAGLALAIGLRAGVVNLGIQGQALVGTLAAVLVQDRLRAPSGLLLAVTVLAAMAAGLAWALVPALLRAQRGVPEAITTVLASFVAVAMVTALPVASRAPARPEAGIGNLSAPLRGLAHGAAWPSLLTWTVPAALLGTIVWVLVLRGTRLGPRLRAMLDEPRAALLAGVRPNVTATTALLLSAAVAGLVGLQDALAQGAPIAGGLGAVATSGMAAPLTVPGALAPVAVVHLPEYGLLAVAVVLAGRASGFGMVLAAFALALLDRAGLVAGSSAGLSREAVIGLQVVLVVTAVLATRVVDGLAAPRLALLARRGAAEAATPPPSTPTPVGSMQGAPDDRLVEPAIDDATEGAHA